MKTSIIKRVPNCFYFQIAEDYKAICLYESAGKIKCNDCAATLLSLYENIVNSRITARVKNPETFPASSSYIQKCLLGHYSEKTIYNANEFLINEGFVKIDRQKTDKENNLPNLITLNIDNVNYMLNEYGKIKVGKNYGTPTVILRNPYRNFTEGGTVNLRTEISIKKLDKEIIKDTPSHSENFNFEKKQNDISLIDKLNEKEKPAAISKNEISGNEINYDKFVERVRELVQLDNEEKRRRYITNMGVKPSNEKANEILQEEFKRYAAKRFGDGCNFPLNNNHERLMKWLDDSSRVGFSDFNLWTCSQYAVQNAAAMMKDKPAMVQEKKGNTGGFSQLIKK